MRVARVVTAKRSTAEFGRRGTTWVWGRGLEVFNGRFQKSLFAVGNFSGAGPGFWGNLPRDGGAENPCRAGNRPFGCFVIRACLSDLLVIGFSQRRSRYQGISESCLWKSAKSAPTVGSH